MKHLNSLLRYWPLGFVAVAIVMAGIAAVPPPPIQRNVITTNTPAVVTFGGIAQVNDTILAWDTVDNQFVDMFIGANLTYTHATHTLSGSAGGSGINVESLVPGLLTTNGGNTLVTITQNGNGFTNLNGTNLTGTYAGAGLTVAGSPRLLGRGALVGSGPAQEITLGSFFTMTGTTLDVNSFPTTNLAGTYIGSAATMNTARVLGRTTAGVGPAEELSAGTGITIAGGQISATGSQTPWLQDEDAATFQLTNLLNLRFTAGGGRIMGGTNVVFGTNDSTSTNKITSGNGAMIVGSATTSSTNHVAKSGSAIFGVASSSSANVVNGNSSGVIIGSAASSTTNEIFGGDAVLMVAKGSAGRGSGARNRISSPGTAMIASTDGGAQSLMLGATGGSLMVGIANGTLSVNEVSSVALGGSLVLANVLNAGSSNKITGSALVGVTADHGGRNEVTGSTEGMFMSAYADGGTNTVTGNGSKMFGYATSGGLNTASGSPSEVHGIAITGGKNNVTSSGGKLWGSATQATNEVTGIGSMMWGYSDATLGSTVSSGDRSFTFGSGNTNTSSDSFAFYSRGAPLIHARTNAVGINTATPRSTLDVNGTTTHAGSVTNEDLLASQFMATDANKREVSTLNGAGLTNITTTATNLYFPLIIETNAGAVMFLDLPVSSAATAGTEQSYAFNVAGTAMLKLQRNHSSAGATTNAVIKTMAGFATNSITDFVIGTRYTNTSQRAWVGASVQLTAAVAGTAIVTLYCEQFQSVTNKVTVSAGPLASLITVEPLTMITSPQAVFYFLDEKTGAGASVGVVAGTCSRIEL